MSPTLGFSRLSNLALLLNGGILNFHYSDVTYLSLDGNGKPVSRIQVELAFADSFQNGLRIVRWSASKGCSSVMIQSKQCRKIFQNSNSIQLLSLLQIQPAPNLYICILVCDSEPFHFMAYPVTEGSLTPFFEKRNDHDSETMHL